MFDRSSHGRRIYVHANRFHISRQHASDGERMLERREHYYMGHVSELCSHDFLSFDYVRCYAGNRSLIANSTGKHDIDLMTDAGVKNASCHDLLMHGRRDPSDHTNRVNGAQMVLVSSSCKSKVWIH